MFVGAVSDNFDERIELKIFHSEIVVDNEKVVSETKSYQKISQIMNFENEFGENTMKEEIHTNYQKIKSDILSIVENEIERIQNDPDLKHLIQKD